MRIVHYKASLDEQLKKKHNNLGIALGVAIYAHARKYMFNSIINKFN